MARQGLVAALLAALALAGCGSGSHTGLRPADREGLLKRVALIRESAGAGDLPTTQRRLRGFAREVAQLERAGELDAATAAALVLGATRANTRAAAEVVPPAPPPQPAQALPPGQAKKGKHAKDEGPGKHGKHGDGEGGD